MEYIIAKLLQDFERGQISRRQLIQSLALAGAAAFSGASVTAATGLKTIQWTTFPIASRITGERGTSTPG
jgi:hypothetical protein